MKKESPKVILTGGAGFIGSHLAEALISRGVSLTIIDNLDDFYAPAWKKENLAEIARIGSYDFREADICDYAQMEEVFRVAEADALIHLAARAGVRPSLEQPCLYEKTNVAGTVNLLELCRKFQVRKLIFGSSSSVYGATSRVPFSETDTGLRPISPYAATKLGGELLCYTYAHLFQISIICLRFFTVYGPRQRPDLAIRKFTSLIKRGEPLSVFGDGSSGRDYTYVGDIVSGVISALEYQPRDSSGAAFEIFNLGNSHPVKLTELIEHLEHATGYRAAVKFTEMPPGDVPITWADISKARRLLGYKPETSLTEGLNQFLTWYDSRASDLDTAI